MKLLYATGPYRYAGHGLRGGSFSAESRDRPHEEGESTGNEVGEQATLDTPFQKKTWSIEIKVYSGLLCTRNTYIHSFYKNIFDKNVEAEHAKNISQVETENVFILPNNFL